jgi:hypothetical protein
MATRQRVRQMPIARDWSPRRTNSKNASKRPDIFATPPLQSRTGSTARVAIFYGEAVGQLWRSVATYPGNEAVGMTGNAPPGRGSDASIRIRFDGVR